MRWLAEACVSCVLVGWVGECAGGVVGKGKRLSEEDVDAETGPFTTRGRGLLQGPLDCCCWEQESCVS